MVERKCKCGCLLVCISSDTWQRVVGVGWRYRDRLGQGSLCSSAGAIARAAAVPSKCSSG